MMVFAFMALTGIALGDVNCTSTCSGYSACSSLKNATNATSFLGNSLLCNNPTDAILGNLFNNASSCALTEAAIEVADLLDIEWGGVAAVEAIMNDQTFWKASCQWDTLAAAACIYFSVPEKGTCTNKPTVEQDKLFCEKECMTLADGCFNLGKYRQLHDGIADFCKTVTTDDANSTTCFKAQVDQKGLSAPACADLSAKATNLTGPYIVAGIALALAVVGLIGLALITCRSGAGGGAPNSF